MINESQPPRERGNDHDLLIRLDENMINLMRRMEEQNSNTLKLIGDLQQRVMVLEKWQQNTSGRISVIVAVSTIVGGVLTQLFLRWLTTP